MKTLKSCIQFWLEYQRKRPFGRCRYRWGNNIKMYHKEIEWESVDRVYLAEDREHGNVPLRGFLTS
jgi:hypothetical protein